MPDPVLDAIANRVAAVEETLPRERILHIVEASFRQLAPARRTLDALDEFPELLTAGSPKTPPALGKLLIRLREAGASTVQQPRCVICGQARVLSRVMPHGRACTACTRDLQKIVAPCARCRKTAQLQAGPAGLDYCRRCWQEMKPGAAARIVAVIRAHRRISPAMIESAIEQLPTARDQRVRLMLELQAHAATWFADPAEGTVLFARFYDLLRANGAQLSERRCGHCSSTRGLTERVDGRISCHRCYRIAHHDVCDGCGDHTKLERRLSDGRRLCQRCTNQLPEENAQCVRCGTYRLIAYRSADGPFCSTCRTQSQQDICTVCGHHEPCRFRGTGKAICQECSKKASIDTCTICGHLRPCRRPGTARAACRQCSARREPCTSCGEIRLRHKRAEDGNGFLCWACTPPIIEACTSCGEDRIVNGRLDGRPFCPLCYPRQPESFRPCTSCGTMTRLIAKLCPRCRADQMIRAMIPDNLAADDPRIGQLRDRWFLGAPSKIIYAFERGTLACTLIMKLLRDPGLRTHAYLDSIGSEQQTRPMRSVLIDHGLLPPRDELLARFETWLPEALATIPDPGQRRTITQYTRWRHLRALRNLPGPVRTGQLSWRRREIEAIIELLQEARRRDRTLATLTQADIDHWLHRARAPIHHFLAWTTRTHHTGPLTAPTPRSTGLNPLRISDDERWRLFADVTADTSIDPHTKFAAGLMLMFGIRASQIVQLRPEDITITDETVQVALGAAPLVLPVELAPAATGATVNRAAPRMFIAGVDNDWLYPSPRAGHHLNASTLNGRLRKIGIDPRPARTSALIALTQQLPPVVISRLTGLEISSAIAWSNAIGATTSTYAAAAAEKVGLQIPDLPR